MGDEELKAIKCSQCSGDLAKSIRYEQDDDETEEIPIATCVSCGREYDQYTQEYYAVYADELTRDKNNTVFQLGLKGAIDGVEYEIIGRIRYQDEDEYEKSTWDEWFAVSSDGVYHYFVEENGTIASYKEYVPQSIDLESNTDVVEFEGKKISKSQMYTGRIVYAEGELPWEPEIGEPVSLLDFKKDGDHFTIEKSENEVSITKGDNIDYKVIVDAFANQETKELYDKTMAKRVTYKRKALLYLAASALLFVASVYSCFWSKQVPGVMENKRVISNNKLITEKGKRLFFSQVLYGPFEIQTEKALYDVMFKVDERVQRMNLEWQSFNMILITEEHLNEHVSDVDNPLLMKQFFNTINVQKEPVEEYIVGGDFWDEQGYDSDGYWHESDLQVAKDFVIDKRGRFYVYLEFLSNKGRKIESVKISIVQVRGYRYYLMLFFLMFILYLVNKSKSKSYNELPFDIS